MSCEKHHKARERVKRLRSDPGYRERERAQQREYHTREETRARDRTRYANLDGYRYNKLLLRQRRNKALARMAKRHAPREQED